MDPIDTIFRHLDQFAAYVGQFSDPFSQRFAAHLLAWREAAGATPPAVVRGAVDVTEPLAGPVVPSGR